MNQNILFTLAALFGVCILTAFILIFPQLTSDKKSEAPSPISPAKQETSVCEPDTDSPVYFLREYEGRLAVFLPGEELPQKVFDVWLTSLPQYDRGQLELGIPIKSYEELVNRIEDYIS